ncbi:FABP family protein [Jatrophihabitans lederbergiae]|uniref:FABP family protein n=1 Tax=Jatrophihabitans lederbergiae TaxID=3075547 RepID=A0ABU2JDW6_9ACTN|nr:FABP family protein [Jatrophihabitans sp. DSM 44399]MDT0263165.1 FABP family protein [Jatrophihabitans sp. DSM 44399]
MADPVTPQVPALDDTSDLRLGPEIDEALLAVLPLVGSWSGHGTGVDPASGEQFTFAQRVTFAHDGRPFLSYDLHSWVLDQAGSVLRQGVREHGFLRMGEAEDELELVLTTADGVIEIFTGLAGDLRWELVTTAVGFTPSAEQIAGERRLYAIAGDTLAYVQEVAVEGGSYQPLVNGQLQRD